MSRAFKDGLLDDIADLGGTGFATVANTEKLSGADLEQARLAARVTGAGVPTVDANGTKTLGGNTGYAGTPNGAALSGADQERFAGTL